MNRVVFTVNSQIIDEHGKVVASVEASIMSDKIIEGLAKDYYVGVLLRDLKAI